MSQAQELLQKIEKMGGSFSLTKSGGIRIDAVKGSLTDGMREALAVHKQDILKILRTKPLTHCRDCPYYDTGPDPLGKSVIHWCGPFEEPGGTRWLNIAELTACPLDKWGSSKTVH